jgi:hypothetical protein
MKNYPIELSLISLLLFVPALIFWVHGDKLLVRKPGPAPISAINLVLGASSANAKPAIPATAIPSETPTPTLIPTQVPTSLPTETPLPAPTEIPAAVLAPTNTPTFREMMKDHIVFYLILPQKDRQDACGDIQLVPIVSRRMRTGDKLADVQIALQMLFNLKRKIYIQWYNALWDTNLTIGSYKYNRQKDYMTIEFAGYLPAGQLSNCDKHGIREQIWTTFFHYGFKEKTFKINGRFLIDELNRKTK